MTKTFDSYHTGSKTKYGKKFVSVLLTVVMLISCFGTGFTVFAEGTILKQGQCGDNVTYKLYSDGSLYLEGTGSTWDYAVPWAWFGTAPWTVFYKDAYPHEEIRIRRVYIGEGITRIGDNSFYDKNEQFNPSYHNLSNFHLPSTLEEVGIGAFCFSGISNGDFSNTNLRTIKKSAFLKSEISDLHLPNSLVSIGQDAFAGCKRILQITIPDSVQTIGTRAFYQCNKAEIVSLGQGVTSIGNMAFAVCKLSNDLTIPNSVTDMGEYCFGSLIYSNNYNGTLTIGNGIVNIPRGAFCGTQFKNVVFGDAVETIGQEAFSLYATRDTGYAGNGTNGDTDDDHSYLNIYSEYNPVLSIPITTYSVNGCYSSIRMYGNPYGSNGVEDLPKLGILGKSIEGVVNFPSRLKSIGNGAFYKHTNITGINFSSYITNIDAFAFADCYGLSGTLSLPNSIRTIGTAAFAGSGFSGTLNLYGANVGNYAFAEITQSYTHIKSIDEYVDYCSDFGGVNNQPQLFYPSGPYYFWISGLDAFFDRDRWGTSGGMLLNRYYYNKIVNITSWNNAVFGDGCFSGMFDLVSINNTPINGTIDYKVLPNAGLHIYTGDYSSEYENISNRTVEYFTKTFEPTCEEKGFSATYSQSKSEDPKGVYIHDVVPALGHVWGANQVRTTPATCTESEIKTTYRVCNTCGDEEIISQENIGDPLGHDPLPPVQENYYTSLHIESYDEVVYCNRCGIELSRNHVSHSTALADGQCGDQAFWYILPDQTNVLYIYGTGSMWDFDQNSYRPTYEQYKDQITKVVFIDDSNFDGHVNRIGDYSFYNYTNLVGVNRDDSINLYPMYGIEEIGKYAFANCSGITRLIFGTSDTNGVKKIDNGAFFNCANLSGGVSIDPSCTYIGKSAFYNDKKITSVNINNVEEIGDYAFFQCSGIASGINLEKVVSVGNCAFESCRKLQGVTFGSMIESIGVASFRDCELLQSLTFNSSDQLTEIGASAFYNDKNLTGTLSLPASVTTIGQCAFHACGLNNDIETFFANYPDFLSYDQIEETESNCVERGYVLYLINCENCGENLKNKYNYKAIDPNAHRMGGLTILSMPTATENGIKRSTCQNGCGYYEEIEFTILTIGEDKDLIIPGNTESNYSLSDFDYSSNRNSIVSVDNNGHITATGLGDAIITLVNKNDQSIVKQLQVITNNGIITGINAPDEIWVLKGSTYQLTPSVLPEGAPDSTFSYRAHETNTNYTPKHGNVNSNGVISDSHVETFIVEITADATTDTSLYPTPIKKDVLVHFVDDVEEVNLGKDYKTATKLKVVDRRGFTLTDDLLAPVILTSDEITIGKNYIFSLKEGSSYSRIKTTCYSVSDPAVASLGLDPDEYDTVLYSSDQGFMLAHSIDNHILIPMEIPDESFEEYQQYNMDAGLFEAYPTTQDIVLGSRWIVNLSLSPNAAILSDENGDPIVFDENPLIDGTYTLALGGSPASIEYYDTVPDNVPANRYYGHTFEGGVLSADNSIIAGFENGYVIYPENIDAEDEADFIANNPTGVPGYIKQTVPATLRVAVGHTLDAQTFVLPDTAYYRDLQVTVRDMNYASYNDTTEIVTGVSAGMTSIDIFYINAANEAKTISYPLEVFNCYHENVKTGQFNTVNPTCTEGGSYDLIEYCEDCGGVFSTTHIETESYGGHLPGEPVIENTVPATASTDGSYDSVVYCDRCGVELSRETITFTLDAVATDIYLGEIVFSSHFSAFDDGYYAVDDNGDKIIVNERFPDNLYQTTLMTDSNIGTVAMSFRYDAETVASSDTLSAYGIEGSLVLGFAFVNGNYIEAYCGVKNDNLVLIITGMEDGTEPDEFDCEFAKPYNKTVTNTITFFEGASVVAGNTTSTYKRGYFKKNGSIMTFDSNPFEGYDTITLRLGYSNYTFSKFNGTPNSTYLYGNVLMSDAIVYKDDSTERYLIYEDGQLYIPINNTTYGKTMWSSVKASVTETLTNTLEVEIGDSIPGDVIVTPSGAILSNVSVDTRNHSIATYSDNKINGVSLGTTTITASGTNLNGEQLSVTYNVRVIPAKIRDIDLPDRITLQLEESYNFNPSIIPEAAGTSTFSYQLINNDNVDCEFDNNEHSIVGHEVGTVQVQVTADATVNNPDYSEPITKTVTVNFVRANVLSADNVEVQLGETANVNAKYEPALDGATFVYESSDPSVATVDANGDVTGVGIGTATITVTSGDDSVEITVTVSKIKVTPPEANEEQFVYDGTPKTYSLTENDLYTITGNVQTDAGHHSVIVSLNDSGTCEWSDGTIAAKTYDFYIAPTATEFTPPTGKNVEYTGNEQQIVTPGTTSNGTVQYKITAINGEPVENAEWSDEIPAATNAGSYTIAYQVVDTDDNHTVPANGTFEAVITKAAIEKPTAGDNEFTYDGIEQTYLPQNIDGCVITDNTETDAGSYTAIVTPDANHVWADDNSSDPIEYPFVINKKPVDVPTVSTTEFVYDGTEKTCEVPAGDNYTVTNNTATDIGEHTATVTLNDPDNYEWADGTTAPKTIPFEIVKRTATLTPPTGKTLVFNGSAQEIVNAGTVKDGDDVINNAIQYRIIKIDGNDIVTAWSNDIPTQSAVGSYVIEYQIVLDDTYNTIAGGTIASTISNGTTETTPPQAISGLEYDGGNKDLVIPGSIQHGTIEYAIIYINGEPVGEPQWSATVPSATNASEYTVGYRYNVDPGYDAVEGGIVVATIAKQPIAKPAAGDNTFTYDGNEKTYTPGNGNGYVVTDNKATDAGDYVAHITPDDNHVWADDNNSTPVDYPFTIDKATVEKPEASTTTYQYDGTEKTYDIPESDLYDVEGNKRTDAGSQTVTVTLTDPDNYAWSDGTSDPIEFTFTVGKATVEKPEASTTTYQYDGTEKTYDIPESDRYDVEGNKRTDAGTQTVTVTLTDPNNYTWSDGTSDPIEFTFTVGKATVEKPEAITTTYQYDGTEKTYDIPESDRYDVEGNKRTDAGTQTVTVTLTDPDNYTWADGTTDPIEFTFTVGKATVEKPEASTTTYQYDGTEKTYDIPESALYNVEGNKRTDAGTQTVTITLTDPDNYTWDDGSSDPIEYPFTIAKADIDAVVTGYEGAYDGAPHTISVTVNSPAGATVTYSLTQDGEYTTTCPSVTGDPARSTITTIYYKIEKNDNYTTITGYETVKLNHTHEPGTPVRVEGSDVNLPDEGTYSFEMATYCVTCGDEIERTTIVLHYVAEKTPTETEDGYHEHYEDNNGTTYVWDGEKYVETDVTWHYAAITADPMLMLPEEVLPLNARSNIQDVSADDFTYSSLDESVVTIDNNGMVTAIAPGKAFVRVSAKDASNEEYTTDVQISVVDADINVSYCVPVGTTSQINSNVYPSETEVVGIVYETSDDNVATVSNDGVVSAVAEGEVEVTVNITVSDNSLTRTLTLNAPLDTNSHTLSHVDEVPATEEHDGVKEHWECTDPDCDKKFWDENGSDLIEDENDLVIHYPGDPRHENDDIGNYGEYDGKFELNTYCENDDTLLNTDTVYLTYVPREEATVDNDGHTEYYQGTDGKTYRWDDVENAFVEYTPETLHYDGRTLHENDRLLTGDDRIHNGVEYDGAFDLNTYCLHDDFLFRSETVYLIFHEYKAPTDGEDGYTPHYTGTDDKTYKWTGDAFVETEPTVLHYPGEVEQTNPIHDDDGNEYKFDATIKCVNDDTIISGPATVILTKHDAVDATPEHDGNDEYFTDVSGKIYVWNETTGKYDPVDAYVIRHYHDFKWENIDTAPDCIHTGIGDYVEYCPNCGIEFNREEDKEIPATGIHTPGEAHQENYVAPTCTTKGGYDTVVRCTVCEIILSSKHTELAALGHDWVVTNESYTTAPTCTSSGIKTTEYTCSRCGEIITNEVTVRPLGHTDADKDDFCDTCGEQVGWRCSKCDWYDENKDTPGIFGIIVKIVHVIVHMVEKVNHLT